MMTSKLEYLYKHLVTTPQNEQRKKVIPLWYNNYCYIYGKVEEIRNRIEEEEKKEKGKLSAEDSKKLLKRISDEVSDNNKDILELILYKDDNGISSAGKHCAFDGEKSPVKRSDFELLIEEANFMSALKDLILTPNQECFDKIKNAWRNALGEEKSKNWLLINRVAAACTTNVSSTVANSYLDYVLGWLIDNEIISNSSIQKHWPSDQQDWPSNGDYNYQNYWFSKNISLMNIIKENLSDNLKNEATIDDFYLSIFVWEVYQNKAHNDNLLKEYIEPSEHEQKMNDVPSEAKKVIEKHSVPSVPKPKVKYGPPGTGKTYQANNEAKSSFNKWKEDFAPNSELNHDSNIKLVQFHSSYSYEDFIEGLRPFLDNDGNAQLILQNGIFKEFCKESGKWELDIFRIGLDWDKITIKDIISHKKELSQYHWEYIFEIEDLSILVKDAVPPFFFIIDEINRAELSRVFGELMYCLEYRGVEGKIETQYANLNNERNGMLEVNANYYFFIPKNIYLIGTMNTIDRSIESFDFALRRRFIWEEVLPDMEMLEKYLEAKNDNWIILAEGLKKLNAKITDTSWLGSDYQIGHAYLMNDYPDDLEVEDVRERIWHESIKPLLQEYLRGTGKDELIDIFKKEFGV